MFVGCFDLKISRHFLFTINDLSSMHAETQISGIANHSCKLWCNTRAWKTSTDD